METATDWFMKDLEKRWAEFLVSETARSRAINASVREYVFFFFFFTLCSPAGMSHPDTAQYQRDFKKEICESSRGLYPSLTAD